MKRWQVTTNDHGQLTDLGIYDAETKEDVIRQVLAVKPLYSDWTYEEQLASITEIK